MRRFFTELCNVRDEVRSSVVVPALEIILPDDITAQVFRFQEQLSRLGLKFVPNELPTVQTNVTHVPTVLKDKHYGHSSRGSLRTSVLVFIQEAVEVSTHLLLL